MESKRSSLSIWTRSSIFNKWNEKFVGKNDTWGLYWQCTDFDDIHRLFKIPYDDLTKMMYYMSKELNYSYNDFNSMSFFEILNLLKVYQEQMEEQQKQSNKEQRKMEKQMSSMQAKYNLNNDIKNQMGSINNNFSNYQMPKYTPPNFNTNIPKI